MQNLQLGQFMGKLHLPHRVWIPSGNCFHRGVVQDYCAAWIFHTPTLEGIAHDLIDKPLFGLELLKHLEIESLRRFALYLSPLLRVKPQNLAFLRFRNIAVNLYFRPFVPLSNDTALPLFDIGRPPRLVKVMQAF